MAGGGVGGDDEMGETVALIGGVMLTKDGWANWGETKTGGSPSVF